MTEKEALDIFRNIYLSDATTEEKYAAIRTVINMTYHTDITKQEVINALDWMVMQMNRGK